MSTINHVNPTEINFLIDNERIVITTVNGQKFEIVVGKETLQVTAIRTLGAGIQVIPISNSSLTIKEQS